MKTYFIVSKNESSKTTNNHSGTPTSVHKVGISVNSTDSQDSESANSDPVSTARDGIANQTSKPLLSDEIKVPSEHNTPQESSLLTTSHQADGSAVSNAPSALHVSPANDLVWHGWHKHDYLILPLLLPASSPTSLHPSSQLHHLLPNMFTSVSKLVNTGSNNRIFTFDNKF